VAWTGLAGAGTLLLQAVLLVLYYLVVTPLALVLRLLRIDVLGLRRDERAATYWRTRRRRDVRAGGPT
jgi:hypothetical protein